MTVRNRGVVAKHCEADVAAVAGEGDQHGGQGDQQGQAPGDLDVCVWGEGGMSDFRCKWSWRLVWPVGLSRPSKMIANAFRAGFHRVAERAKVYPGVFAQVRGLMLVGQGLTSPASRAALPAS